MSQNTFLSPWDTEAPAHFPTISQPKIIGCFSLDEKRIYIPDAHNCKYVYKGYQSDRVNYNLNDGIEHVIRKPESAQDEKLNHLLEFIIRNKKKLKKIQSGESNTHNGQVLSTDFVCFRGLLRLLMCTPYEKRDAWIILATKYKGTIYLCAQDTKKQIQERKNMSEATKRILSYGFKFEQFILSDDPSKKPATNVPVNECEEFCCLYSATLNGQKILYGAEMDGIECDQLVNFNTIDFNQCSFVELKVKLREKHSRQQHNYFRFKLRNWWCQSFLVNIKKIIVGTRNDGGIVNELSTLTVKDIPKMCQNYWLPSVCMEFCSQFLKLVAKKMERIDSPYDVIHFEFDPTKSENIFMKIYTNQKEHCFLPDWFIEELETMQNE